LVVVAGACSSFDASDPGNGEEAGTVVDGASDAASADAAIDGGPQDGAPLDAGWIPCAKRTPDPAHFCDDFDGTGRVDQKWTSTTGDGGTIAETDAAVSTPRALVLRLAGGSGQGKTFLRSNRGSLVDVAAKNHLAVSFSMRIDKLPFPTDGGSGYMHVALIELDQPSCDSTPGLRQRQIEVSLFAGGTFGAALKGLRDLCSTDAGDYASLSSTIRGVDFTSMFRRVTVDISRVPCNSGAPGAAVRLAVDGASEVSCQSLGIGNPFAHGVAFTMQLGLFTSGTWGETAIAYDDVSVDFD
jgi:hypothetical protein